MIIRRSPARLMTRFSMPGYSASATGSWTASGAADARLSQTAAIGQETKSPQDSSRRCASCASIECGRAHTGERPQMKAPSVLQSRHQVAGARIEFAEYGIATSVDFGVGGFRLDSRSGRIPGLDRLARYIADR